MSLTEQLKAGEWKFTPEVTAEFDTHVAQSVPHYSELQSMIGELSDWLVPDRGTVADLGASTGTSIQSIAERHPNRSINAHLYDIESHMLDAARQKLSRNDNISARYHAHSITQPLQHKKADLTIASLTLQFLTDSQRRDTLKYAHAASVKSGGLVLIEKVYQSNPFWQDIATDLTQERKEKAGLAAKEIRDKQASIRGVLRPHTTDYLVDELHNTGWQEVDEVFRWHNWIMLVARAA